MTAVPPLSAPRPTTRQRSFTIVTVMGILTAAYVLLGLFMWRLGFQFVRGDIIDFWNDSLMLQAPFSTSRLPVYPIFLAAARTITSGAFPGLIVMMAVNLICLLAGAWCVSEIARLNGAADELAAAGGLLFGLWPLAGLPYTVFPMADVPAASIFMGGVYFLRRSPKWAGIALIAAAMMTHKIMWPLGALTVIADALSEKPRTPIIVVVGRLAAIALPVVALWIAGALHYHSLSWIIDWNVQVHILSNSGLPILDGAIGTILQQGVKGLFKGGYLLGTAALAAVLAYFCYRDRPPMFLYGIAVCSVMIGVWLFINQYEIWALARFGRLLALPVMLVWTSRIEPLAPFSQRWRGVTLGAIIALVASQFVYAWYMVKVFYV